MPCNPPRPLISTSSPPPYIFPFSCCCPPPLTYSGNLMYSSLFSAGLIQLWDAESPPLLQGGFPKQSPSTSSGPLKSFLSFDDCTLRHQSAALKHRASDKAAVIPDADHEYRVFMRASSPSPSRSVISFPLPSVPGPLIASTESNCQLPSIVPFITAGVLSIAQ